MPSTNIRIYKLDRCNKSEYKLVLVKMSRESYERYTY